jgi:hypothetical protein
LQSGSVEFFPANYYPLLSLQPMAEYAMAHAFALADGDRFVQLNEVTLQRSALITWGGNYNPDNPTALSTPNSVDPGLRNDKTVEWTASIDHQLRNNMAVSLNYIYRRYSDFRFGQRQGIAESNWVPVSITPTCNTAGARCPELTYYRPNINLPAAARTTNANGYARNFNGIEAVFTKRMSSRWMVDGNYAFNNAVDRYDAVSAYSSVSDPTNFNIFNGFQFAQEAGGSGIDNVFVNAKHLFKLAGVYVAPFDINLGAFFNYRQGYLFPQRVLSPNRPGAAGSTWMYIDGFGESRYDSLKTMDMRVSRRFGFGRRSIEGSFDVFNLGNVNTVLTRNLNQAAATANQVTGIVAPRVARVGIRLMF